MLDGNNMLLCKFLMLLVVGGGDEDLVMGYYYYGGANIFLGVCFYYSEDAPAQSEVQNIIDALSPEEAERLDKLRNIGIAV